MNQAFVSAWLVQSARTILIATTAQLQPQPQLQLQPQPINMRRGGGEGEVRRERVRGILTPKRGRTERGGEGAPIRSTSTNHHHIGGSDADRSTSADGAIDGFRIQPSAGSPVTAGGGAEGANRFSCYCDTLPRWQLQTYIESPPTRSDPTRPDPTPPDPTRPTRPESTCLGKKSQRSPKKNRR